MPHHRMVKKQPMAITRTVGRVVRRLRLERGWSQVALAEKLGMTQGVLSAKERGKISITPFEYGRLARVFGISVEEFEAQLARSAQIPVLGLVSAGPADRATKGTIDQGEVEDASAFALVVDGDSMEPWLSPGDYVVFLPAVDGPRRGSLTDGAVVLAEFRDSRRIIARYFAMPNGTVALTKDNPAYPPTLHRPEEFERLAVAVERRSPLF